MTDNHAKVLMLITDFGPPWTDGIKNSGRCIAAKLSGANEVLCTGLSGENKSFECEGCMVELVKSPYYDTWLRKVFLIVGIVNLVFSARRRCQGFRPDVVLSNMETASLGFVGWMLNWRLTGGSAPHIQIIYADYFSFQRAPIRSWLSEYLPHWIFNNRLIFWLGLKMATDNIAVSRYLAGRITTLGASNVVYAPIGVDPAQFRPVPHLRARFSEPFVIGYLGHITYVKGVSLLIDAYKAIRNDINARLILSVTNGSESDALAELQQMADVTISGPTNAAEFFASCDVYVLPRRAAHGTVNLPNTVLEAMACEAVVLTSALPGVTELIEDGQTGYLFKANDGEQLAARLLELSGAEENRRQIGRQARLKVKENYSWERIISAVEVLVRERI